MVRLEKGVQPGQKSERVSPHHWRVRIRCHNLSQGNLVYWLTFGQALAPTALTKVVYLREDKLRRKGMAAVDDGVAGLTRLA